MNTKVEIVNCGPDKVKVRVVQINVPPEPAKGEKTKAAEHVVAQEHVLADKDRVGFYVHKHQYLSLSEES